MKEYVIVNGKEYPVCPKGKSGKRVKLTIGTHPETGAQVQRDYTGRSAAEIQEKIDASMALSDADLRLNPEEATAEELAEEYIRSLQLGLQRQSVKIYRGIFHNRVLPFFQNRTVRSIQPEDVRAWQSRLRDEGRSENYVHAAFCALERMMEFGRKKGYIHCNPCRYAKEVRLQSNEQSTLNDEQIRELMVGQKDYSLAGICAVAMMLGLRNAEVRALSWKQIDWKKGTVCICRQAGSGRGIVPHTKTGRNRTLLMPKGVLLYLRRERERQRQRMGADPALRNPEGLVFTDSRGRMISYKSMARALSRITERVPGDHATPHSLRRTVASILAEDVSIHAVQYYLGHQIGETAMKYVYPRGKDMDHLVETVSAYYERQMKAAGWEWVIHGGS